MTVARFLLIFYRYAARLERYGSPDGLSTADLIAMRKEQDSRDVSL